MGNGFFARNKSDIKMGLTALIIAGTADLFAGLLLESMEDYLYIITGMMILIYSAIGMRGNIFGAMGSRIGTAMHIGTFSVTLEKGSVLRTNAESAIALTMIMSLAMGFTTWFIATLFFDGNLLLSGFIFISALGGFLAGTVVMLFNILIAWAGYVRDWDVDNITDPLIAAIGDIVTMPMIFFTTWLYLEISGGENGDLIITVASILLTAATMIYACSVIKKKIGKGYIGEGRRIVLESLPVLMFCLIVEIGAGVIIQNEQDFLIKYAVLLIMLPAFLNEGNALSGMLTARLSSMIHLGTMKPEAFPPAPARENFHRMYICAAVTYIYIGTIAYVAEMAISGWNCDMSYITAIMIIAIAGAITTVILNFLSYYVAILATRFGLDPDDHCIPITSSVMDLTGALVLVSVVFLLV